MRRTDLLYYSRGMGALVIIWNSSSFTGIQSKRYERTTTEYSTYYKEGKVKCSWKPLKTFSQLLCKCCTSVVAAVRKSIKWVSAKFIIGFGRAGSRNYFKSLMLYLP